MLTLAEARTAPGIEGRGHDPRRRRHPARVKTKGAVGGHRAPQPLSSAGPARYQRNGFFDGGTP